MAEPHFENDTIHFNLSEMLRKMAGATLKFIGKNAVFLLCLVLLNEKSFYCCSIIQMMVNVI